MPLSARWYKPASLVLLAAGVVAGAPVASADTSGRHTSAAVTAAPVAAAGRPHTVSRANPVIPLPAPAVKGKPPKVTGSGVVKVVFLGGTK